MILKELRIKNFRSYYGENVFAFKDGLTLIIGGNGDGKTSLFDSLSWLFKTTGIEDKSAINVSEMRASEMLIGQSDELSVILSFEHDGEKILEKRFRFEKDNHGNIITRDYSFLGYEIIGSERPQIPGNSLLERCFDATVRKYCLFKGESELNVFENDTALKTLVDKFSDIRTFDKFVELAVEFEQKSDDAHKKELRSDNKVASKAKELDLRLQEVNRLLNDVQSDIKQQKVMAIDYQNRVEALERNQEASERYHDIKDRIKTQEDKKVRAMSLIDENYNFHLLDDMWILCAFPSIFKEYRKKYLH